MIYSHTLNSNEIKILINNGVPLNLYHLLSEAVYQCDNDMIQYILGLGIEPVTPFDVEPYLHKACIWNNINGVKLLLKHGFDVNEKNRDGRTPLFLTSNEEILRLLLDAGADWTIVDNRGITVLDLHGAHGYKNHDIIELIESYMPDVKPALD